jgi:hypothetical protein
MSELHKNEVGLWEKEIDGKTYAFQKWGAEKSLDVLTTLVSLIGEPMSDIIADYTVNKGKISITETKVASITKLLFSSLKTDRKMVLALIRDLTGSDNVFVDGKQFGKFVKFDTHYDDITHLFTVAGAALEVQYGSFFGDAASLAGLSLVRNEPSTPPTQTAKSGGSTPME